MRPKRVWYPGAMYHVTNRGVHKCTIVFEDEDAQHFFNLMRKYAAIFNCQVHAYCLMTNHFHMLIETQNSKIGDFVGQVSQLYAMFFNRKYDYEGHLFQDRFYSKVVEDERYFLECSRYIHLNPVKAYMVMSPEQYSWGSYRTMIGLDADELTEVERTLDFFSDKKDPREAYRKFVIQCTEENRKYEEQIRLDMMEDEHWEPL